jgi:ribosomal protein S25
MSAAPHADESPALSHALWLAELGLRVIAVHAMQGTVDGRVKLCTCGEVECSRPAKHPVALDWIRLATTHPDELRAQWKRWPWANVGIATGHGGVVVLDVDGEAGERSLAELEKKHGKLPECPTVRTARGRHLYFKAPGPLGNRVKFLPGLDLRADGGFVVAPPSVHETGFVYAWFVEASVGERAAPAMPLWLHALVARELKTAPLTPPPSREVSHVGTTRADRWAARALELECATVRQCAPGSRNDTLNRAAFNVGTLVGGKRLELAHARAALLEAALACKLSKSEATKTIAGGLRAGMESETRSAPTRDRADYTPPSERAPHAAHAPASSEAWEPDGPSAAQLAAAAKPTAAAAVEVEPLELKPRFTTAQIFAPLAAQTWLVPSLQLGPGRPTLIPGYGASAKSLAAQQLELAIASGRKVWDHFETLQPGRVLHIDYEQGFHATAKRFQRLARGHGIDPAELGDRITYVAMPRVYLDKREHEEIFVRACEGYDLIVVDALRGAAPHTDENDSAFRGALDLCTYISQETNATVVLLHHAAKPKEGHKSDERTLARGTSAIYDASGCVLNFVARANSPARLVTQVKMPADAEGGPLDPFELVVEDVAIDGEARAGVRVVWRVPEVVDVTDAAASVYERDAALILKAVRRYAGQSANAVLARCGVRRARANEVLRALTDEGRLELTSGKNRTKFYRVVDRPNQGGSDE